ncbi:MAG: hypothetical protein K6C40_03745 [Thermoguttaceae bacterium]|nr:hypothetical protein [Thermoguttaceae bacterium]
MANAHPDLLFQTRSGITPHVLWAVPWTKTFFGKTLAGWETRVRKMIYALFQLVTQSDAKFPREILNSENLREILGWAMKPEALKAGAFPILAVARSLNALTDAQIFTPEEAAKCFSALEQLAADAQAISPDEEPLAYLLLAGELPLTLACVGRKLTTARKNAFLKQAKKVLNETLADFLDGAGMPRADLLPVSRLLAASWVRSRWLDLMRIDALPDPNGNEELLQEPKSDENSNSFFSSDALSALEWAVRLLMYCTRPDGSMIFTRPSEKTAFWCPELFVAALKIDSDRADKKLAVSILPDLTSKNAAQLAQSLPNASNESSWGRVSILQTNWQTRTGAVVTWDQTFPKLEILSRKVPLISGEWSFRGTWKGKPLTPQSDWREIFWHETEEADYVELELELSEGFTLQRHVLLAKEEHFLLLGDALSGDDFQGEKIRNGELLWQTALPIFPASKVYATEDSLELFAGNSNGPCAVFLPLALPEWREKLTRGNDFRVENGSICADYQTEKSALYAPIFIDLDPQRMGAALTWRQLKVGEKLQNVPPHRAAGFRVQIDDAQWLFFRSLAECCNRSVLGHNPNSETYFGIFKPDGNTEAILDVEKG